LLLKAWQVGGQVLQQRLIELLFQAQFEQNEDIGDVEMLSNRAERAGLMSEDAVRYCVPVYLYMFLWSWSGSRLFRLRRKLGRGYTDDGGITHQWCYRGAIHSHRWQMGCQRRSERGRLRAGALEWQASRDGHLLTVSHLQIFQKLAACHIQELMTPKPMQVQPPVVSMAA
jgi:hypothetical protein